MPGVEPHCPTRPSETVLGSGSAETVLVVVSAGNPAGFLNPAVKMSVLSRSSEAAASF